MKLLKKNKQDIEAAKSAAETVENADDNNIKTKPSIKRRVYVFMREMLKIILVLAGCGLLGMFLAFGNRAGSSYRFAESYFSYYVTNNYTEMYKMIDTKENKFITFDNFQNKCEGEKIYGSIKGYSLSKPVKQGKNVTYVVTYYVGNDATPRTYTITLRQQKKHTYLFFNTWKVDVKRFFVNNYNINVPAGTSVKMDGIDISECKNKTSEDGATDTYVIDRMFSGDHTIAVTLDADNEIAKTEYVSADNSSISITTNDFAMKPDVQQKLYEYSTFVIKSMYEYAMDKTKNFQDISAFYASTEEAQASARATFDAINAAIQHPDGGSLRVLNIKTLSPEISSFNYPDKVAVRVTYTYDFSAVTGTSVLSGIVDSYDGSGTTSAVVYLNLIDDAWKIVKVDMNCVDYSKQD